MDCPNKGPKYHPCCIDTWGTLRLPGGKTLDMCRCCEVCAFVKDEVCGGRGGIFGACDQGLKCKKVNTLVPGIGIYETTWKCAEDGSRFEVGGYQDADKYKPSCPKWASSGHCITNPVWMNKYCCSSCSRATCTDNKKYLSSCPGWARQGECKKKWMWANCCKSCQAPCKDDAKHQEDCPDWAKSGECNKNKNWMWNHCCKSCRTWGATKL